MKEISDLFTVIIRDQISNPSFTVNFFNDAFSEMFENFIKIKEGRDPHLLYLFSEIIVVARSNLSEFIQGIVQLVHENIGASLIKD